MPENKPSENKVLKKRGRKSNAEKKLLLEANSETNPTVNVPKNVSPLQCTMIPLSTRSCLKSNKLRPILNGQFCHAISKNIGLNLFGSKQPREILVFVILKL